MAKRELHSKAVEMRQQGMSYSQIKAELGVSKGSLSLWLQSYPLSRERINELRGNNEQRIERYREARARTRNNRRETVYEKVGTDIGILSPRELLLTGLFLYWGEGGKTHYTTVTISNTDPAVLIYFKKWLNNFGIPNSKLKVRLQLYADMNVETEICYWSKILRLPKSAFSKPYIKSSNRLNLTYKQRFVHGTCNLVCHNRDVAEYTLLGVEWLRNSFIADM
jgi:hypothetical protein